MALRTVSLPSSLQRRAFTVTEAREAGVTLSTLRSSQLDRPFHGVRHVTPPQPLTTFPDDLLREKAHKYIPLLRPGEAFSHSTALTLLGAPIHAETRNIHVTIPSGSNPARGRGVLGHRCTRPINLARSACGAPCVPFTMALEQAASVLPFRELVVALDSLLHQTCPRNFGAGPHTDANSVVEALTTWALKFRGRGSARLRAAVGIARVGAESRMETLLRLELVAMGHDDVELQTDIYDDDGEWIGRFDLADRLQKRLLEYDGEQHRLDRTQYLKDQERLARAWAAGYQVLRLGKEDLTPNQRARTRRRVCKLFDREPQQIPAQLHRYLEER